MIRVAFYRNAVLAEAIQHLPQAVRGPGLVGCRYEKLPHQLTLTRVAALRHQIQQQAEKLLRRRTKSFRADLDRLGAFDTCLNNPEAITTLISMSPIS